VKSLLLRETKRRKPTVLSFPRITVSTLRMMIDTVLKKLDLSGNITTRRRQLAAYADDILITAHTRHSLIDTFQQLKNNSVKV
jgi:hypothetical protein